MRDLAVSALLLVAPPLLQAQTPADTARLHDIVVTATRYPVPPESLAATLTVLRGEDLRAQGIAFVGDALRQVPGVQIVQSGSYGSTTSAFVRGGESDYVKVLVDGVPVNQPGGAFDFGSLTTDNIERIEILRGPASVLYGSDAVSGVVQIITRRGDGPTQVNAGAEAGTYGTLRWNAGAHGGRAKLGWSAAVSRLTTDGIYDFNNDYRNTTGSAMLTAHPDDRTNAALGFRLTDGRFAFPTDGTGAPVDQNQFNTERTTTLSLDVARRLSRAVQAQLLLGRNKITSGYQNPADPAPGPTDFSNSQADVERRMADARLIYSGLPRTTLMAGAGYDHQHEHMESDFDGFADPPLDTARVNWGFYVQASGEPTPWLRLTAGGRLDDNDRFGQFWTYRVSGLAFLTATTRLRSSVGNAFKEPSFFENFSASPFALGNPNLLPERSVSFEGGIEQDVLASRLALSVTGFAQRFRDLIQYTTVPPAGGPNFNYFNIAAANASGIEASVSLRPIGPLGGSVAYTWTHTKVTETGPQSGADFVVGQPLIRRPAHAFTVRLFTPPQARAQAGAALHYVGSRDDLQFIGFSSERVVLPAYATVDLSGSVQLLQGRRGMPGAGLTARVENLFDKNYEEIAGFRTPGRTILVGITSGMP
ncbi:MAG TPA: TonB-dependent receptor [Gemmatimonadales bacterium]|nr:TonB-dependent receptor [Gemmatimonadales bacterium]